MFPSSTIDIPARRSLRELMRDALGSALEFATLGEATIPGAKRVTSTEAPELPAPPASFGAAPSSAPAGGAHAALRAAFHGVPVPPATPAPPAEHPHRAALVRPSRPRRPGAVPPRPPVCTMPVHR